MSDLRENPADQIGGDSDLRLALMSAYEGEDAPAPVVKEPKESTEVAPKARGTTSQVRGDNGQFVPKTEAPAKVNGSENKGATAQAGSEAETTAVRNLPASWSPDQKEAWSTFSPAIQDYILKREKEYSTGIQERSEKLKTFEEKARDRSELDRVLTPYREKWALNGISDHQQIQRLLAAQDLLNRDPAAGLRYLAQSFGLNPAQLATAAQNQPTGQLDNALAKQVADLSRRLEAREKSEAEAQKQAEQEAAATIQTEIDAFKADPANKHFDAVKDDMKLLLGNGRAVSLQDAYEKAVRLDPTLHQQFLDEQIEARAKAASGQGTPDVKAQAEAERAKEAAKVAKAKSAMISVRGAPSGPNVSAPKASLREELLAAFEAS